MACLNLLQWGNTGSFPRRDPLKFIIWKICSFKGYLQRTAEEGGILGTTAQAHRQDLERLELLRYIDDDFMTVCLADNYEGIELILRIILGRGI